jgi:hypothetical protein
MFENQGRGFKSRPFSYGAKRESVWRLGYKIKKDRIDQRSPRCPDCFGPSVLSKLGFMFGKLGARKINERIRSKLLTFG